ncbi:MAG: adenine deaminase [Bacillota bacterium]
MNKAMYADLVLKNGKIINVLTREIVAGDIAVKGEFILKVGNAADLIGQETKVVDLQGKFVSPGFIDSHMHFESSMLTVSEFARLSIPSGTTTLVADPHEIGNALGPAGIKAMTEEAKCVPNNVYFVVPCLTPDSPGLETAGYDITSKDMEEILNYYNVIGIGELQGFSNAKHVYKNSPEIIDDLVVSTGYAKSIGKIVDGNAPELFGSELAAHIICGGGVVSCHETTKKEECIEKLRQGVYVFMREGSTQRNMSECIKAVTEEGMDSRRCILVTDDMVAEDLEKYGHMNDVVRRTITQGVDPVEAIQMVTINPAAYFKFEHLGVLAPGKQADIVILDNLQNMNVQQVYIKGKQVAENKKTIVHIPEYEYPITVKMSVKREKINLQDLAVKTRKTGKVAARVIGVIPDQNLTEALQANLFVDNGIVMADTEQDIIHMACLERYGRNKNIGRAFVKGFGLKKGAFAESIAHDTHNIIAVGANLEDMALAVNRVIEMNGGISVVNNKKVLAEMRLPIAGLMTDELSGEEVTQKLMELHECIAQLGGTIHAPLMHLSFLALTTSPVWKITDYGLIDVDNYTVLPPLVD